jgi:ribosomal protein S2
MRIKNRIIHKNKFIKLKLLETKIYTNTFKNSNKLINITTSLKKILNLIYKYHINNKRILFIGPSIEQTNLNFQKIFKSTKHLILPKSIWMNGIITNSTACFKYIIKNQDIINKNFYKAIYKLNSNIDLIVILESFYTKNILKEGYLAKIPVILLENTNTKNVKLKPNYLVSGNFKLSEKKTKENFIYLILFSIFKKINKIKNKNKKLKLKKPLITNPINKNYK